ncbi:hypothetical protein K388_07337 [Streptomyces sp. KhCrAH-43]|uniref:hypothetical protein n=1 Tax=unclassified Streptomyces TaxID=2593676 RepID=UPI000362DB93|nr:MULTISPECIES: hypothetical protein [unclassified Streptomyces]MYS33454.1 hypothetical protein [Streptomyces sp. SID4920]MYX63697.1 hypothetical protein [Streptomyces sp. SID8373]RAJ45321.1 hypothetical protein K388_07337 [Streptomyces sp. KhCrAH-43]
MTTPVTRRRTVTARIDDAVGSAPAPAAYTATVYMNTHRDIFDGYEPHHPLAAAIRRDDSALRLVFRASDRIRSHEAAAEATFEVGNHQGADDNGQSWPGNIRSVSVGDVIKITGPDTRTVHLSVDSYGFSPVPEPTTLVPLTDPRVTHRD